MPHAGVLGLYEACLRLRRHCSVFRPSDRSGWQVAQLGMGTAAIRFGEDSASFLLIINLWGSPGGSLEAEPVAALPEGWRWALRLSTNAPEFGGTSSATFDLSSQTIAFSGPEALLFEAGPVTKR